MGFHIVYLDREEDLFMVTSGSPIEQQFPTGLVREWQRLPWEELTKVPI